MAAGKYYVVWKGRKTGVFDSWNACEGQVRGFAGAEYKAFETHKEAEAAFTASYIAFKGKSATLGRWVKASVKPILPSICVDAACKGSPGPLEYRGVDTGSGDQLFHAGPFTKGTNNIGEFLAIVHALTWMVKHNSSMPVYSDSNNAISWVKAGSCQTQLKHTHTNAQVFAIITSAENWLADNSHEFEVLKWDTKKWGEIPADFGRK